MELALHDLSGGKNSTFETLINPERDVPRVVSKLTNISTDLVRRPDVPRYVFCRCIRVIPDPFTLSLYF